MIREYISRVVSGHDLSTSQMREAMEGILQGAVKPSQLAAFLVALRLKGETAEEIAAAAEVIRRHSSRIRVPDGAVVLDRDEINLDEETVSKTCSLDGSLTKVFNISTATALVVAGGGLVVAKTGARSESTFCGSANVVESLGVSLNLTVTEIERCIDRVGLGFLYANLFHTPLAVAAKVREEIGVRTLFNLTGPLTNPAGADRQVLGVYLPERTGLMAEALKRLGSRQALVVYGLDTLDEMSITGPTRVHHLKNGTIDQYDLLPEDVGLRRAGPGDISGGDAAANARIIMEILDGAPGPRRDVVLLNAAAAFLTAEKARDWKEGVEMARESIDSGQAKAKLDELVDFTAKCGVYQHKDVS